MRIAIVIVLAAFIVAAIAVAMVKRSIVHKMSQSPKTTHVVLVGASIGQEWHLAEWPARVNTSGFSAESLAVWQFDKAEAVEEVLMRPARKVRPTRTYLRSLFQPPPPKADLVILKECSSYFPGDLPQYRTSIEKWVNQLQANHNTVILATVVPVTAARAQQDPGKQEGLVQYNEWIREYARQHGMHVLDLESALRRNDTDNYLREDFATSDGSHLNAAAYTVLDKVLRDLLSIPTSTVADQHLIRSVTP